MPSSTTHSACQMLSWEALTLWIRLRSSSGEAGPIQPPTLLRRWTLSSDALNTTFMWSKTTLTAALTTNQRLVLK